MFHFLPCLFLLLPFEFSIFEPALFAYSMCTQSTACVQLASRCSTPTHALGDNPQAAPTSAAINRGATVCGCAPNTARTTKNWPHQKQREKTCIKWDRHSPLKVVESFVCLFSEKLVKLKLCIFLAIIKCISLNRPENLFFPHSIL